LVPIGVVFGFGDAHDGLIGHAAFNGWPEIGVVGLGGGLLHVFIVIVVIVVIFVLLLDVHPVSSCL